MRLLHICLIIGLSSGSLYVRADPTDSAAAQAFFENYAGLSDAYDDKVADLYADSAVIRACRRYPHGLERSMELSGSQWKALLIRAMPIARAQADRSTYSNVEVSVSGDKATIKADRHAVRKCYTDTGYYMVVERQAHGEYLIVEEYSETQPQSNCQQGQTTWPVP